MFRHAIRQISNSVNIEGLMAMSSVKAIDMSKQIKMVYEQKIR